MIKIKTVRGLIRLFVTIAVILAILIIALIVALKLTWRPVIKDKTDFSSNDISVIASELSVPEEGMIISDMHYSHAKESCFIFKGSSTLSLFQDCFEYIGMKDYKENYKLKNKSNTECSLNKTDNGCDFEIILKEYNKKLLEIMN